uniref:Immunoglobulin V-set domain-containing protein n=1 Tax=Pelusios castaneus TaxID=367368 RepID=A0A8C8RGW1_9SAUR
ILFLLYPMSLSCSVLPTEGTYGADSVTQTEGRFNATHDKKDKSFHLWKPSSDLSDSAIYYCAVSNTMKRTSRGAEQKPLSTREEKKGCGDWGLGKLEAEMREGVYKC